MITHTWTKAEGNIADDVYEDHLQYMQSYFAIAVGDAPIFRTDLNPTSLWEMYLGGWPQEVRQYHNCNTCRKFIENFGGLAVIDPTTGLLRSPIFSGVTSNAEENIHLAVKRAAITGVFYHSDGVMGEPVNGPQKQWRHFSLITPKQCMHGEPGQKAAEKLEDMKNIRYALTDRAFTPPNLRIAVKLLESESLYRSEKVLGAAEFLLKMQDLRHSRKSTSRPVANLMWLEIAKAPAGFCHPRSSMIGTLLDDIADGRTDYAERFAAKMNPTQYRRPIAPPKAGAIDAAEKLVEKLGIAPAFKRRYARAEELQPLWVHPFIETAEESLFEHLRVQARQRNAKLVETPMQYITFAKLNKLISGARKIQVLIAGRKRYGFCVFTTAEDSEAPPILQWDHEDARNPVSCYWWREGSTAAQHGLTDGWHNVQRLVLLPWMWGKTHQNFPDAAAFVIEGAGETREGGNALFPEILKGELHGISRVMEAHANSQKLAGMGEPHAVGLNAVGARIRVWDGSVVSEYFIDRWD